MTGAAAIPRGLRFIAAFKLFKGLVLFAAGVGAVKLLHKDLAFEFERWAPDYYWASVGLSSSRLSPPLLLFRWKFMNSLSESVGRDSSCCC